MRLSYLFEADINSRNLQRAAAGGDVDALGRYLAAQRRTRESERKVDPVSRQTKKLKRMGGTQSGLWRPITPDLWMSSLSDQRHLPFVDMQTLTPDQAVQAAVHARTPDDHGGVEIYVQYADNDMPDVGYVFNNGMYIGHGLGSERTDQFIDLAEGMRDQPVEDNLQFWKMFFVIMVDTPVESMEGVEEPQA